MDVTSNFADRTVEVRELNSPASLLPQQLSPPLSTSRRCRLTPPVPLPSAPPSPPPLSSAGSSRRAPPPPPQDALLPATQSLNALPSQSARSPSKVRHEGVEGVQSSNSRKRKRTSHPSSTPEVDPSSAMEVEGVNPSSTLEAEVQQTMESNHHTADVEFPPFADVDDYGDGDGDGEEDDFWEGEHVSDEGRIDNYLHGEEDRKFRSKVWKEFIKVRVAGVVTKGQCIHFNTKISAKRGAGTSAMGKHLTRCKVRRGVVNISRQLKSAVMSPQGVSMDSWRFSQAAARKELIRMITLHGFPLSIVDYDGVRRFVSSLNLVFKMVSRRTISRDSLQSFQEQKKLLQDVLRNSNSRVSLTMDMWTSKQTIGYMCITCHFIDEDWKMHSRIIKFSFLKTPHTGLAMFNEVLKSIQEWNIEGKLFAITLNNAGNNNSMVKLLRSNLLNKHMLHGKGKMFHHRCAAHVVNLICKARFEVISSIVHKVRESVKFIEGSTSRKEMFEEIILQLGITYKKRPNIDVSTRWNSTYLMLDTCLQLKDAFDSLGQQEPEYTFAPSLEEWEKASLVCNLLKTFYDATMVISGSLYPTANLYFHEIWEVKVALESGVYEANANLSQTISYMKRKFKKYWKLTWLQISFPVIFDPRFKLEFIDFRLKQAFGSQAESKVAMVKKLLLDLFNDYSQVSLDNQDATHQIVAAEVVTNAGGRYADWDHQMRCIASSTSEVPSELETYLAKPTIPRTEKLDILAWWKCNSVEYPTLSRMARDVLAVQASTVASESAFSTGRRIVSDFRSRLTPTTVEALVCLQNWMRADDSSEFRMEGIEDVVEPDVVIGW